ncbi:hypothetical protein WJX77_004232 [Trebouxia sp. C0004]
MQAQTAQAQPLLRLPALKQLIDELADRRAQHLKAKQGFLAAENLVAALQGLGSFAAAVLGAFVAFHPLRGRAAQNDDAVMYYSAGLYMAQRRFASFSHSNAPDPDDIMQACVDASNFCDPDSPAGYKAKTATAEARQCKEADPSCSASTLSNMLLCLMQPCASLQAGRSLCSCHGQLRLGSRISLR